MNPEELFDECCTEIDSAYVRLGPHIRVAFPDMPEIIIR